MEEVRLALVLDGGVGFAVWTGGVVHELDLLRRASRGETEEGVGRSDLAVFRFWRKLTAEAPWPRRVRIDVVSGASAVGLNGVMLATAIARDTALPGLREMWQRSAALDRLLAEPSPHSVFNGDFLQEELAEALGNIPHGDAYPGSEAVTLFVTATALDGRPRSLTDGFGNRFDVPDHRRLYRFERYGEDDAVVYTPENGTWKIRKSRPRNDFTAGNTGVLVRAARATAGFPLAFPPVSELPLLEYRELPKKVFDDPAGRVVDGGLLAGQPFGPVLDAITRRPLDRKVRRVVVHVAPSGGRKREGRSGNGACAEVSAAIGVFGFPQGAGSRTGAEGPASWPRPGVRQPREELFARFHAARMGREVDILPGFLALARGMFPEYRFNRARDVLLEVRSLLAPDDAAWAAPPRVDTAEVQEFLARRPGFRWALPDDPGCLTDGDQTWQWGFLPAERALKLLSGHLQDRADLAGRTGGPAARTRLVEGVKALDAEVRKVRAVRDAVTGHLRRSAPGPGGVSDREAARLLDGAFAELGVPEIVAEAVRNGNDHYTWAIADVEGRWGGTWDVVTDCLVVEILTRTFTAATGAAETLTPRFDLLRLAPDTMSRLFHEERFSDLGERKLYGVHFRHCGALLDPGWRHSDFTWGRLDAARHLLPLFLSSTEDVRAAESELHRLILNAEFGPDGLARMREHLTSLQRSGSDLDLLPTIPKTYETLRTREAVGGAVFRLAGDRIRPRFVRSWARRETGHVLDEFWRTAQGPDPRSAPQAAVKAVRDVFVRVAVRVAVLAIVLLALGFVLGALLG